MAKYSETGFIIVCIIINFMYVLFATKTQEEKSY